MPFPPSRSEALAVGSRVYQTAKACKYGHFSPRDTVNGWCLECRAKYLRNYKQIARDAIKAAENA